MIFKTFHGEYNNKEIKIEETHESPLVMLVPLFILSIGAVFAGFLFKGLFIGYGENLFWAESIKFLEPLSTCLLYTSPSPRDRTRSRMPSSA